ncbi:MAG: CBS domain-containing protein [Streptosporangiaceae bacterium]
MNTTVKDVMTTRVIWVKKAASFREIASALREHKVSAFPVLDAAGKVIGVVSEADLLTKEALYGEEPGVIEGILHRKDQEKARGVTAGELMTAPPMTVRPDDSVENAARLMYARKVKRLPVVDANNHLVGIVSRSDLLTVFDRSDAEIRKEILTEVLGKEFTVNPDDFAVTVKDGVVTIKGTPETGEVGREIAGKARHVQGVVAVRDRLSYPPPEYPARSYFPIPH